MHPKFDINTLLQQAFGTPNAVVSGARFQVIEDLTKVHRLSYLGTPVIAPITFKGQKYQYYNDVGELDTMQLDDFELPAATLSSFSRKKNISETELTAGYGAVKEMYGFSDWQIEIRGLCLFDPALIKTPTIGLQQQKLLAFEKVAEAIPVVSDLYNDKGIDAIVIKQCYFEQLAGQPGVIPFRLMCVSDTPNELIL